MSLVLCGLCERGVSLTGEGLGVALLGWGLWDRRGELVPRPGLWVGVALHCLQG